jgi:hypothetical protein
MSMLLMLALLAMLIARAGDPAMWRWLASDNSRTSNEQATGESHSPSGDAPAVAVAESTAIGPVANLPAQVEAQVIAGATDEDEEERAAAIEEFQAVFDGGTAIQPEEMHAYRRLFKWVDRQPVEKLRERSAKAPSFNDLMQEPAVHRGSLARLDLNLCRVLKYDPPAGVGGKALYELWGWRDDTQGWLYVVVTPELPAGIPLADRIDERAHLYGYFFKLQGYHAAGAKPGDSALKAPLFVGRVVHQPARRAAPVFGSGSELIWLGIACVIATYFVLRLWVGARSRTSAPPQVARHLQDDAEDWLNTAQRGEPRAHDEEGEAKREV